MPKSKKKMEEEALLADIRGEYKKLTPQRVELIRVLIRASKPMTARELYEKVAKTQSTISLDTVYRNLLFLTEKGLVSQINLQNKGNALFEFQGTEKAHHHHHAICTTCGGVFCIDKCTIRFEHLSPEDDPGFAVAGHAFEVYGLCTSCQKKSA